MNASTDAQTLRRAQKIIDLYFHLVRDANPRRWESGRDGYIATNPGVRGFLLLFAECCTHLQVVGALDPATAREEELVQAVAGLIEPALAFVRSDDDVEIKGKFSRKFGEGGVREYFENLAELVCSKYSEFGSDELRKILSLKKDQRRTAADADIIKLSKEMLDAVVLILKSAYGEKIGQTGDAEYWRVGIESANIKSAAYDRQLQDKSPQPREGYLGILDLKAIVRQKNNWAHFQDVFNIPLPGERGKTYYLDWMEKFNELRRIPAHPSGGRTYAEEDYEVLKHVKLHFYDNLGRHPLFQKL